MGCGGTPISKPAVQSSQPLCATGRAEAAAVTGWVLASLKPLYRTSDEFSETFLAVGRRRF